MVHLNVDVFPAALAARARGGRTNTAEAPPRLSPQLHDALWEGQRPSGNHWISCREMWGIWARVAHFARGYRRPCRGSVRTFGSGDPALYDCPDAYLVVAGAPLARELE
jgi:hypothetical protein